MKAVVQKNRKNKKKEALFIPLGLFQATLWGGGVGNQGQKIGMGTQGDSWSCPVTVQAEIKCKGQAFYAEKMRISKARISSF